MSRHFDSRNCQSDFTLCVEFAQRHRAKYLFQSLRKRGVTALEVRRSRLQLLGQFPVQPIGQFHGKDIGALFLIQL